MQTVRETGCLRIAFFVFRAGKRGVYDSCELAVGISGIFCRSRYSDIYSDDFELSVSVYWGDASDCANGSYSKRAPDRDDHSVCLWLWRYVCFGEYDAGERLPNYCKPGPDPLSQL